MSVADFVSQYLPFAQSVSSQTGLPVDYVLAQSGLETGWGTSNAAVNQNNFFGISPGGSLASYSDPTAGFSAYGDLVSTPRYASALSIAGTGGSVFDIAQAMNNAGYSTTPDYAARVSNAAGLVDQYLSPDQRGPAGLGSVTTLAGTTTGGGSVLNPLNWPGMVAGLAGRFGLGLVGVLLIGGGIFLFGLHTVEVERQ